nr:hypothetical protein [Ferrovum sp.]
MIAKNGTKKLRAVAPFRLRAELTGVRTLCILCMSIKNFIPFGLRANKDMRGDSRIQWSIKRAYAQPYCLWHIVPFADNRGTTGATKYSMYTRICGVTAQKFLSFDDSEVGSGDWRYGGKRRAIRFPTTRAVTKQNTVKWAGNLVLYCAAKTTTFVHIFPHGSVIQQTNQPELTWYQIHTSESADRSQKSGQG